MIFFSRRFSSLVFRSFQTSSILSKFKRELINTKYKASSQIMAEIISSSIIQPKNSPPIIASHNGTFHCDDALACFLLKQLPELINAQILRTRTTELIDKADVVVDVGAIYDHKARRYDHHQKTFVETMNSLRGDQFATIKLSSAGLVYHHYGLRIVSQMLENTVDPKDLSNVSEIVFFKVYERLIKEIDAIDNGVSICSNPKYEINTHLSKRVKKLNPDWNEESTDEILLERFFKAMDLVGREFCEEVKFYGNTWYPVRAMVKQAVNERFDVDPSGEIIDLSNNKWGGGFPWKEHLLTIEEELGLQGTFKFVVFVDLNKKYRVQAIPMDPNCFETRVPLNKEWQGLRDEQLVEQSQIPGSSFVHASGFIGGNENREGAIQMARKSIKLHVATS